MKSLMILETALLEENQEGIKEYLSEIDRKTGNECMQMMGEALGFNTMEIEGMCYAHLKNAALILGYSDPSGLSKLMSTYQIMTPKIGWYGLEVRPSIRETFELSPKDSEATFIPYEGILVAGMQGQTEGAKKIKLYLLKMERAARVGMATIDQFKYEAHKIKTIEKRITLAAKIERMSDNPFRDAAIEAFEELTGKSFPKSPQLKLL